VSGAPAAPRDPRVVLKETLAGLNGSAVVAAQVGRPPGRRDGRWWFYARVAASGPGSEGSAVFEADLVQGAVAEGSGTSPDLRDDMSGSTIDVVFSDGKELKGLGGMGNVRRGQVFVGRDDAATVAAMRRKLERLGLQVLRLEFRYAPTPAPVVVVEALSELVAARAHGPAIEAITGKRAERYVGYYLELRGPLGKQLARGSAEFRTGAGRLWYRSDWCGAGLTGPQALGTLSLGPYLGFDGCPAWLLRAN
jgi:hypothetical protein